MLDRVIRASALLTDEEAIKSVPEPFTSFMLKALKVLQLAERAVANTHEALRLADRVACISFAFVEAMSVKHPKGAATAKQVQTYCSQLDKVIVEAVVLLLGFQADGTDFKRLSDIERFKATYRMYFPGRVGAFLNVHKNLTAVVKEATLKFSLMNPERCDAPSTEDIRNSVHFEVHRMVMEVQATRAMDANTNNDLDQLMELFYPDCIHVRGRMPSTDRVRRLFEKINAWSRTTTRTDSLAVVNAMLEEVKGVDLHPFEDLGLAALKVIELAQNAIVHKDVCFFLAGRAARTNFIVLELVGKNCTDAIRQCASELAAVIRSAATLLEGCQSGDSLSWPERVKVVGQYSAGTAEQFAAIHEAVTRHVTESSASAHSLDGTPLLRNMRKSMRDEMVHVAYLLQWLEQEGQSGVMAVVQRLQALLDSPAFKDVPQGQSELDPCDVIIDMSKALAYGESSRVYAGTLYGLTEVAVKVVPLVDGDAFEKMAAEVCRMKALARHCNVVHVFGIVELDARTGGVVMERLAAPLQLAAVSDLTMRMKYTLDIIAGMEHVHSADERVRFDFSPTRLLLTQDGRSVKINDYYVEHRTIILCGTVVLSARNLLPFMAPELFVWRRTSPAFDVYAFAVIVAELWTGTVAELWEENEVRKSLISDIAGKAERRPFSPCELSAKGVPAPIIAIIVACWAQEPERRPTFTQLSEIRTIPNFHLAPQEAWPSFLRAASSGLL
jgi:hypothetical protein